MLVSDTGAICSAYIGEAGSSLADACEAAAGAGTNAANSKAVNSKAKHIRKRNNRTVSAPFPFF